MPPRLKQRDAGERPPPAPAMPAPEPKQAPVVSEPETIGQYDMVVIDDEEPDLTIDLDLIVEQERAKRQAQPAPEPEEPKPKAARPKNPFLPNYTIMDKIRL